MQTLAEAKGYLRENWEEGVSCPCCNQMVKLYKYKLSYGLAKMVLDVYRLHQQGREWVHIQSELKPKNGDYAKLRHWDLLEARGDKSDDGNSTAYWRLTEFGRLFARCERAVPSHALLFDSRKFGTAGEYITIRQALGNKFNYDELMKGII